MRNFNFAITLTIFGIEFNNLSSFLFLCFILFSFCFFSELVSIVELCQKKRSKQQRKKYVNLDEYEFASEISILYKFSENSVQMTSIQMFKSKKKKSKVAMNA